MCIAVDSIQKMYWTGDSIVPVIDTPYGGGGVPDVPGTYEVRDTPYEYVHPLHGAGMYGVLASVLTTVRREDGRWKEGRQAGTTDFAGSSVHLTTRCLQARSW